MRLYTVAHHTFGLEWPEGFSSEVLRPYSFFREDKDVMPIFTLVIKRSERLPIEKVGECLQCFHEEMPCTWLYRREEGYAFGFSNTFQEPEALLLPALSGQPAVLYVYTRDTPEQIAFALNNSLMLLYALSTASQDTLLVHASTIEKEGMGYLFLGRSGTGKSTHGNLWLTHIEGAELLNDDNPVIRLSDDGKVYVYGSPWSGKTPCYKNRRAELKAIVRLSQAPFNRIIELENLKAYASLLPSCSCMRWERRMADNVYRTVEQVVLRCSNYQLECLPDKMAALLCFRTVTAL
ncbi:hypothetical protein [uncultured Parabacteroides sp.]|uniref:hypothetical protein n=1 Tax=uncultured Parabacteroides sp. TaxID=512312 RepID=UPI0026374815|nr:hypothetical protein [uncultured Parabacteroides sp.]